MKKLNRANLAEIAKSGIETGPLAEYPVKVMQFGEGNFLRAFIDWMIDKSNEAGKFGGSVRLIQPLEHGTAERINAQDGLYTLILRGVENGKAVERRRIVTCVTGCLNAVTEWEKVVETACLESLELVFSNTTEAGIEYKPEEYTPGKPQKTYPAKLAALLYARFHAGRRGLVITPCELIDRNGSTLRECVLRYAADWKLEEAFSAWIESECVFLNTLVDRIVAGYPRTEAEAFREELGYEDNLLDCGELFHLFVIEGDETYRSRIPFAEAGLHVVWTRDQSPYRTRKVRFLNGGHTGTVPAAYLAGFDFVDRMTADPLFGEYLRKMLFTEIFPTVDLPDAEKKAFAEGILERFLNPYAHHPLISISLNSVSKWRVRNLPSLLDYVRIEGKLPEILTFSFAALLAFCRGKRGPDGQWRGSRAAGEYPISDDPETLAFLNRTLSENSVSDAVRKIAGRVEFWGCDLNGIPGFAEAAAKDLEAIDGLGIVKAVQNLLGE